MLREDQFIPQLIVHSGRAALAFYREAFGAEEVHRMMTPDGRKLVHGELTLDGHKFFVSDEFAESEGGTCRRCSGGSLRKDRRSIRPRVGHQPTDEGAEPGGDPERRRRVLREAQIDSRQHAFCLRS